VRTEVGISNGCLEVEETSKMSSIGVTQENKVLVYMELSVGCFSEIRILYSHQLHLICNCLHVKACRAFWGLHDFLKIQKASRCDHKEAARQVDDICEYEVHQALHTSRRVFYRRYPMQFTYDHGTNDLMVPLKDNCMVGTVVFHGAGTKENCLSLTS
jgi:hypothetical protein